MNFSFFNAEKKQEPVLPEAGQNSAMVEAEQTSIERLKELKDKIAELESNRLRHFFPGTAAELDKLNKEVEALELTMLAGQDADTGFGGPDQTSSASQSAIGAITEKVE